MPISTPFLRLDPTGALMLALVAFVGWAIARYSHAYLAGEAAARLARFRRALGWTLACVTVVVLSNHLLLTAVAWVGTSLTLHLLLTHYGDRWQALLAAHKKFIAGRIAEVALFTGIALLGASTGTLQIDGIAAAVHARGLDWQGQAGMFLIALAALLKCAQLPAHGWLIQVMEAPTPVSALLHAGIINLSGFVLIRLAEPLAAAPAAQWLLLLAGGLSAAAASLVAMTRVSIKVALAWSTCAQMGFMLLECALGLPQLALLHLVGHSLYKAHAFLASGDAVQATRQRAFAPAAQPVPLARSITTGALALAAVGAAAWQAGLQPATTVAACIAALAIASMLATLRGAGLIASGIAAASAMAVALVVLHDVFALFVPAAPSSAGPGMLVAALSIFVALYLLQALLRAAPQGPLARRVHPWCFGGFFLDEHFTRITFRIWPLRQGEAA
jgi:NAD(P)H-quinone oxidoreductase subunit 5